MHLSIDIDEEIQFAIIPYIGVSDCPRGILGPSPGWMEGGFVGECSAAVAGPEPLQGQVPQVPGARYLVGVRGYPHRIFCPCAHWLGDGAGWECSAVVAAAPEN